MSNWYTDLRKINAIDFKSVTDELAKIGYEGWIVVEAEQDPAKAPPYEYSKRGYDHILEICRQSGLDTAVRR